MNCASEAKAPGAVESKADLPTSTSGGEEAKSVKGSGTGRSLLLDAAMGRSKPVNSEPKYHLPSSLQPTACEVDGNEVCAYLRELYVIAP